MREPIVEIRSNSIARLNNTTLEKHFSTDFEYVELYYHEEKNRLAFVEVEESTEYSFDVFYHSELGAVIDVSLIFEREDINIDEMEEYTPKIDVEEDMVFIQL